MSMYEMLFPGAAPDIAANILARMGIPQANYRLRDAWIEPGLKGDLVLRILTRIGGGNRQDYAQEIANLQRHQLYLFDHDEAAWDATYASFYFRVPENLHVFTVHMLTEEKPVNMSERAAAALASASARWERGEFTEAEARIRARMQGVLDGGGNGIIEI